MTRPDRRREVWVVDDSPTDLELAARTLSRSYAVRKFQDGSSMLEELSAGALPDVLVLDWVMTGVSGVDICAYLRSAPRPLAELPVLMLTAKNDMDQLVEGLEAGANDYLTKPWREQELLARVGALVRLREVLERAERAEADVLRLLSSAPDALFVVDQFGKITFANQEAARVTGTPVPELLGSSLREVIPGMSLRNISVGPGESFLPLPDIELGDRVFSPSVRLLPSDNAASTTVSLRDVTDRRRAEERRLDFYSMIAHDLRTPLAAMLLRTDVILRGKYGILRADLSSDIRKIATNARALVAMINDFLELARLEGTGHKVEREPVELASFVRGTGDEFLPLFDSARIRWVDETGDGPALVLGDRTRLAQVMTNLLGNAVKFTPPGGVVTTRIVRHPDVVEVQIQDTGPGIDPAVAPRLFGRYQRATDAAPQSGTGLGLMIVREIVHAHGGEVGVNSEPGVGSTFWFRLPAHHAPSQSPSADAQDSSGQSPA